MPVYRCQIEYCPYAGVVSTDSVFLTKHYMRSHTRYDLYDICQRYGIVVRDPRDVSYRIVRMLTASSKSRLGVDQEDGP